MARPTSASGALATVIETARSYQGTPYVYGGTTRNGLDCSGLLQLSFAEAGITIPRSSNEQAVWGDPIKPTELRPGDLLFFGASPGASTITHVGLVTVVDADGVEFIHASSSLGVVENSFELDYYLSRFIRAVRPRF
jgi:cell wall-associated NlpC family hydrolase